MHNTTDKLPRGPIKKKIKKRVGVIGMVPCDTSLSARELVIELARGDMLKKYAPDSDFNTTKEGRTVRDAISKPISNKRGAVEAMAKADIAVDLTGKHTAHRKAVDAVNEASARSQASKRSLGLHHEADAERLSTIRKVGEMERDYGDSYLGKKKATYAPTAGSAKQNKRAARIFKKAPQKVLGEADKQSLLTDRNKFSQSAAAELRESANILRGARKAAGGKVPIKKANEKFVQVLPGLKKMVGEEVDRVTKSDPARATAIRGQIVKKAEKAFAGTKDKAVARTAVKDLTSPLFRAAPLGQEIDTHDKGSIAKKLNITEKQVDTIHRRHAELTQHTAVRRGKVAAQVIKEGKVFEPIRSAANAAHDYPFLSRNAKRAGRIGKAAALGGLAGGLIAGRKKKEPQLAMSDGSAIIALGLKLSKKGITLVDKKAVKRAFPILEQRGYIEHGAATKGPDAYSYKEQAAHMEEAATRARAERDAALNGSEHASAIAHLEQRLRESSSTLTKQNRALRDQASGVRRAHEEEIETIKKAHSDERASMAGDFSKARKKDRKIAKRVAIASGALGAGTGLTIGRSMSGRAKDTTEFGVGDILTKGVIAAQSGAWRAGKAIKAAGRKVVRRFPILKSVAKGAARGALVPIPGAAEAGAAAGAITHVINRHPAMIERRVNKLVKYMNERPTVRMSAKDDDDQPSTAHDVAVGGIEGGLGVLATDKLIHRFAPPGSGIGRKLAIGAGVGAAATGLVGAVLSKASRKQKQNTQQLQAARDLGLIEFFISPPRGAVTSDRYRKAIHEREQDRKESNYLRSGVTGGALGAVLTKAGGRGRAAAIGAGAGVVTQAAVRAMTNEQDQFGEESYAGKRIQKAPWQAAALATAGIGIKKAVGKYGAAKAGVESLLKKVKFEEVEMPDGQIIQLARLDDERADLGRWDRAGYATRQGDKWINRAGRAGRLVRDTGKAISGEKNIDSRGRERTPEYKKPWVKKAVGAVVLGLTIRKGFKTARGLREAAAAQKAATGETHGIPRVFDEATSFVRRPEGGRSGLEKLARKHRDISRPLIRARREIKGTIRDTKNVMNDKVDDVLNRWTGTTPDVEKAKKVVQKSEATEGVKKKLRQIRGVNAGVKPPKLTEMSAAFEELMQFAITVDDWDISHRSRNSAVVRVPGAQKRIRRQKSWDETAEGQRTIRNIAIGGAATGGVVASRYVDKEISKAKAQGAAEGFKEVPGTHLRVSTDGGAETAAKKASAGQTARMIRRRARSFRLSAKLDSLIIR